MFSSNFDKLLDPSNEEPQILGNSRKIGKGLRINSSDGAELGIAWNVGQSPEHEVFGRQGRFVECRVDDVENVTRKTISFRDSGELNADRDQHFLCVARTDEPTEVLVTVAWRETDQKFVDVARTKQAIGKEPTGLMVTVPASETDASMPTNGEYRFNVTTKRPGRLMIQIFDVRYCFT